VATLPDWRIHVPGHPDEAELFLRRAAADDEPVYIRLAQRSNATRVATADGSLVTLRRGPEGAPTIVAVGPMLDATLAAVADLDATVLYTATVRPFDGDVLQRAVTGSDVVLIEPYLEGTSAAEITRALAHRPVRLLSIGVPRAEHRRYGAADDHDRAHGLDAAGLRARIAGWLAA